MKIKSIFSSILLFILAVYACFYSTFVWAGQTGKITGKVTDAETGSPLPGVNVIFEGTTMGAATDLEGDYIVLNVPPGTYTLKASMMGYSVNRVTDVRVSIDRTTTIGFQLSATVMEFGEEIVVTAEVPLVQRDLTSSLSTVSSAEIAAMPVEEFKEVLELQAGIVEGSDGEIHIRGGRASEIAYLIDGVSVTDPFSGDIAIEVENAGIQELQVVSGAFNAEYGQAMSGIVDIATKDGGPDLSGNFSAYGGDYVSRNDNTFLNIDDVEPLGLSNVQVELDGPLPALGGRITFFALGRYYQDKGTLFGRRLVTPGFLNSSNPDSIFWAVQPGDSVAVSMNPFRKISTQGKLTFKISPVIKFRYGIFWDRVRYREYDHTFKYNPDGDYQHRKKAYTHILTWTHALSARTFYTVKFSNVFLDYRKFVYENPLDPRYVDSEPFKGKFYDGGTKLWHVNRNTSSFGGKFDMTSQITKTHQVKLGIEARRHKLYYKDFRILVDWTTGFKPLIPANEPGNVNYNEYTHHPFELSVYLQDKMEFQDMIVNAGIRYDFFDPDGKIPLDPQDPDNAKYFIVRMANGEEQRIPEREYDANRMEKLQVVDIQNNPWVYKYKEPEFVRQISPRIGIAYPITDRGIIHFSYGHFYQTPPFEYLYYNSELEVRPGPLKTDVENKMGNAALKPQRTVIYEIGLQQQLTENIGLDITGYYKDIRNLLGTEIIELYDTRLYARYVNRDYGNVRGFTLALNKRPSNYFSAAVDYTFQIAEGNASDPNDAFLDVIGGRESEIRVVPLDWDQTHTLNMTLTFSEPGNWGMSLLGKLGSGLPYTHEPPQTGAQFIRFENNERIPPQITFDLKAYKDFRWSGLRHSVFLKVYNLFDRKNEVKVYNDTGRAGYTLASRYWGEWQYLGSAEDFVSRADYYSQPRRVIFGMSLGF